ncbi:MAG: glycosyltransferase family 39 protein [bacterium]|nr:glycosyltransferase family 39 protein [bacterium]
MKNFIKKWYPLFIILIPAISLRVNLLLHRGSFWFDELFSIHFSSLPSIKATLFYWLIETNPPFYTIFLKFYLLFVGNLNETLVRLPSLFFSILSIILVYIFAQKISSRRVAIISSSLMSISTLNLLIATEARIYSILTFLTIVSFIFYYKLIIDASSKQNKYLWFLYFVVNLLLLYSHLTSVVIVLTQFILLFVSLPEKRIIKKWYKGHIIIFLIYGLWFIPSLYSKLTLKLGSAWYFTAKGNIFDLILKPIINANRGGFTDTLFYILLIFGIYLLISMIKTSSGIERSKLLLLSLWAFLPPILSALLNVYILKYITIAYPGLFLLFAYIADKKINNSKLYYTLCFMVILIALPSALEISSSQIFSWHGITQYIEENENESSFTLIPFAESLPMDRYYKGTRPVVPIYLNDDDLKFEERLVRFNWSEMQTDKEKIQTWLLDKIQKYDAQTIYFIGPSTGYEMVDEVLISNGWTLSNTYNQSGLSLNKLNEFHAPINKTTTSTCQ